MIKKEITKKKSFQMNLALAAIGVLLVLGCPASSNSTGGPDDGGDTTAPTLMDSNPPADSTSFSADAKITLTYNEPVQAGTGNITIVPSSGGTTLTIAVGDAQVSIAGAVVTIDPTSDLAVSTTYTLTIPAGAFMDAAGNKTAELTLSFSTAAALDTTAPTLQSSNPPDDATGFPANSAIILTYSEPVQVGTGGITFTLSNAIALTIPVSDAQVSIAGRVVTINPTANLELSAGYVLTIPAGAFMDASGNNVAEDILSFTTAADLDETAPTVSSSVPADDATDFPANSAITLTFDELVQVGTGDITITPSGGNALTIPVMDAQVTIAGAVVTIDPTANLELSAGYVLTIPAGAFMDLSGNNNAEDTLSFTTAAALDETAPTLSSSVPVAGATDFRADDDIVLTYSEAVQRGTGSITITPMGGGTPLTIPVADTVQVTIADNVVTIDLTANLELNTRYTLTIPAGGFIDTSGNSAAELTLSFTIDTIAPTFSSSMPAADATGFNASSNIVLTYNEAVQAGTGDITITPSGGNAITIDVTGTQVSFFGATVTINPTADLAVSTTYALSIAAGAIQDLATNDAAIVDLSFSTAAVINPVVISSVPVAGATDFRADDNIVLTFSEVLRGANARTFTLTPMGGGTPITFSGIGTQVSNSGAVVTINPTANLELNTQYVLAIPAGVFNYVSDMENAEVTLSFTTAPVLAPRVISSVPAEGGVIDRPTNELIVLTFNEVVVKGTGTIRLDVSVGRDGRGHSMLEIDVATDPKVTISDSGTEVTIDISSSDFYRLRPRPYALTVPATAFVDEDGNNLARDYTLGFSDD